MGKQTIITCDKCGKNLAGGNYTVLSISSIAKDRIVKQPSFWLCPMCWMKTGLIGCEVPEEKQEFNGDIHNVHHK